MSKGGEKTLGRLARFAPWGIMALIGLALILFQRTAKDILFVVTGVGLIVSAAIGLVNAWNRRQEIKRTLPVLLLGNLALLALGIWILANGGIFDRIVNIAIGLVMIVVGIQWLVHNKGFARSRLVAVLALISAVLGLVIIFCGNVVGWMIVVEGIGLIYAAILGLLGVKNLDEGEKTE